MQLIKKIQVLSKGQCGGCILAKHMPWVATADATYSSLKTDQQVSELQLSLPNYVSYRRSGDRKENYAPGPQSVGQAGHKLPWADGPGCTPERTSGFLLWSPGPVFTGQSPNGGNEEERSNCWMAHPSWCVRLWQHRAMTGRALLNGIDCLIFAQGKAEKNFSIPWTFLWDNIIQILRVLAKAMP